MADLPTGWSEAPELVTDDTAGAVGGELCGGALQIEEAWDVPDAERGFKGSELGPFLLQTVAEMDDEGRAQQFIETMLACAEEPTDAGGFTVGPLPFPALGDGTVALQLSTDGAVDGEDGFGLPLTADIVVVREGSRVTAILTAGVTGAAAAPEELEAAARAAVDRLGVASADPGTGQGPSPRCVHAGTRKNTWLRECLKACRRGSMPWSPRSPAPRRRPR